MFKKLFSLSLCLVSSFLSADIIEIHQIDDIRPYIKENALYLFDIDDTLIHNPFTLGSGPWRNWARSKIPKLNTSFNLFDALTLYIANKAPYVAVESTTANLIDELQENEHTVFGFTARGRSQWYTTDLEGIDRFTQEQLQYAGIDFSRTRIPQELQQLEETYFCQGIIFASHIVKGELLEYLLEEIEYYPSCIIFVDDRLDQVQSVEAAAEAAGIPFVGFWYRRSELDHHFHPMITNIQLEYLIHKGEIISDEMAFVLAQDNLHDDHQGIFENIFYSMDINLLAPAIHILNFSPSHF